MLVSGGEFYSNPFSVEDDYYHSHPYSYSQCNSSYP